VDVIYSDAEYFGDRSGRWHVPEFDLLLLVRTNFIDACAVFRKTLWEEVDGYDAYKPLSGWEDWDLWLRAAAHGGTFFHLPEIRFDYRVRRDSMIVKMIEFDYRTPVDSLAARISARAAELINHIFTKPALACYKLIRETDEEVQELRGGIRNDPKFIKLPLSAWITCPSAIVAKTVALLSLTLIHDPRCRTNCL
jgi:hypothetical protein